MPGCYLKRIFLTTAISLALLTLVAPARKSQVRAEPNVTAGTVFTKNVGQWPDSILFRSDVGGAVMWLTADGIWYQFTQKIEKSENQETVEVGSAGGSRRAASTGLHPELVEGSIVGPDRSPDSIVTTMIKAEFVGASESVEVTGLGELEYKCNYFIGNDKSKWRVDVPNYSSVSMRGLYSGIDVTFSAVDGILREEVTGATGSDLSRIEIEYRGVKRVDRQTNGMVAVESSLGEHQFEGVLLSVPSPSDRNNKMAPTNVSSNAVSLAYSTYLGGGLNDDAHAIALNGSGNAYVSGLIYSTDFPTQNPFQGTFAGDPDAFVTKLSATGNSLVYSTYLGGSGIDVANGIAVDSLGQAYVAGYTSDSADFPTVNPFQGTFGGGTADAFITKLSASGNSLMYSTYLGGNSSDVVYGIAVDSVGQAYVAGSTGVNFPTQNAYQGSFGGGGDAFVTKFSASGNALLYSTYLGGSAEDVARSIALAPSGEAVVSGYTWSTNFPTQSPFQASLGGGNFDAFVTKLSTTGGTLVYSTYLGGNDYEVSFGVAVDGLGQAYVTGYTRSANFPTQNPFQGTFSGGTGSDAFVTKFSSTGNSILYSTYLGGNDDDGAYGIAVDGLGQAYLSGTSKSTNFPTQNPFLGFLGNYDGFVSKLSTSGSFLIYSTYLGGATDVDIAMSIAVDGSRHPYVAGRTVSTDFPIANQFQATLGGAADAFVTKLSAFGADTVFMLGKTPSVGQKPFCVRSADFNGDGKFDLVTADPDSDKVTVLLNIGSGNLAAPVSYSTGDNPWCVAIGDLNSDGAADLASANYLGNSVSVIFGNGDGTFSPWLSFSTGVTPDFVSIGDFNGDGKPDLVTSNYTVNSVSVLLNSGAGAFPTHVEYTVSAGPQCVVASDVDMNGSLDLVVAQKTASKVSVLKNLGSGTFGSPTDFTAGQNCFNVYVADVNGNGSPDLLVANGGDSSVSVLINDGTGGFGTKTDYRVGNAPVGVTAGDFNHDGSPDFACVNEGDATVSAYLNTGTGSFTYAGLYPVGTAPYSIVSIDINGDGRRDIVSADYESKSVSELLNNISAPHIHLSNSELSFSAIHAGSLPANQQFTISNSAGATMQWAVADSVPWLDISPVTGSDNNHTITVSINSTTLSPGLYLTHVVCSSSNADNGPLAIAISYTVQSASCCLGLTGNVDCDGGDGTDISDLSALIDYLYISFSPLCCAAEANTDGQPGVDIADLSALIDYLYISFTPTAACQ